MVAEGFEGLKCRELFDLCGNAGVVVDDDRRAVLTRAEDGGARRGEICFEKMVRAFRVLESAPAGPEDVIPELCVCGGA